MRKLTTIFRLTIAVILGSAGDSWADNLTTCSSGQFPVLCKRHLLTPEQAKQADAAERSAPKITGLYSGGRIGGRSYNYDVSGSGDTGAVTGSIDATSGSRDVEGTLTLNDGSEVSFDGEWVGKGEIEGADENGNSYTLEVD